MPVRAFPNPYLMGKESIIAIGGDLHAETLRLAYGQGIFPWPHEGYPLLWFCPPERAILDFSKLHIPRSLEKAFRKTELVCTLDTAFDRVIRNCCTTERPEQDGTWITPPMLAAYCHLHDKGIAHSVEVWDPMGNLVGGLYGVDGGGVFSGESMFHTRPNASKLALLFLIDHLQECGLDFIDIQQLTPHMQALGAEEIPRAAFLQRLHETQSRQLCLFPGETHFEKIRR